MIKPYFNYLHHIKLQLERTSITIKDVLMKSTHKSYPIYTQSCYSRSEYLQNEAFSMICHIS